MICLALLFLAVFLKTRSENTLTKQEYARLESLPDSLEIETPFLLVGEDAGCRTFSCFTDTDRPLRFILSDGDSFYTFSVAATLDPITHAYACNSILKGLREDRDYSYFLTDGKMRTDLVSFHAAKATDGFTFLFAADPQLPITSKERLPAAWERTVTLALDQNPDAAFLLSGGDQVDDQNVEEEYLYFDRNDLFSALALAPNRGNHDEVCKLYNLHFPISSQWKDGSSYAFSFGTALFAVVDSNQEDYGAQADFLKNALMGYQTTAKAAPDWFIVTMHHPMFSNGDYSGKKDTIARQNAFAGIFQSLDVDLVLMGHEHNYSRSKLMAGGIPSNDASAVSNAVQKHPGETLYITASTASGVKYYQPDNDLFLPHTAVSLQMEEPQITMIDVSKNMLSINTYITEDYFYPIDTVTLEKIDD